VPGEHSAKRRHQSPIAETKLKVLFVSKLSILPLLQNTHQGTGFASVQIRKCSCTKDPLSSADPKYSTDVHPQADCTSAIHNSVDRRDEIMKLVPGRVDTQPTTDNNQHLVLTAAYSVHPIYN